MQKTFIQLLGEDAPLFRRYVLMAIAYGLLCGLTIIALVPVLTKLLAGDVKGAAIWLGAQLVGLAICWGWRRHVEQAGVRVGVAILQGGRHRLGDHVSRLPVGWFTSQNTARLGHVVTQGVMTVAQLPAHVFTPVISGLVMPLVIVIVLFMLNGVLGLIALTSLPLLAGVFLLAARASRHADDAFHRHFADASQRIVEFAQLQPVLRAFSGEGGSTRFLEQSIDKQRRSGMKLIYLSALSAVLNAWAIQAVSATLFIVAALWLNNHMGGDVAAGEVVGVIVSLLLVSRFIEPLQEVSGYSEVLRGARGQLEAIHEIFAVEPLLEADPCHVSRDASIELRDVYFRYAPHQPEVLCGVSLRIEAGSMTALIGASGSGKTTMVRLVARLFDVNQGSVLIGGVDVRQMSSAQLSSQISQIFQDTYLFTGSIAENIRIGKPDASDAAILEAARQAGVVEIIDRLPLGVETPVGEGGTRLSGGERQRIAIARALLKDAPILLVDEATAALDAENQTVIAEALVQLRGRCTLIVIAHQLSTVAMADQIVVLDRGQIVEHGSPAQLQANPGRYATFLSQRRAAKGWRIAPAPTGGARD